MKIIRFTGVEELPASHEDPKNPGVLKKVLIDASHNIKGTVQMVNWATLLPGKSFQPHYHEDMYEIFVMIKGNTEMTVDGEKILLHDGDTVIVEPGEVHEMKNPNNTPIPYIVVGVSGDQRGKSFNVTKV